MKDYKNIIRSNFFSIGSVVAFIWNNDATWSVATVSKNIKSIFGYEDTLFLENKLSYSSLIMNHIELKLQMGNIFGSKIVQTFYTMRLKISPILLDISSLSMMKLRK